MTQRSITDEERVLIARAHDLFPGGSVGNVYNDVVIRRGQGSHVWDVSGNEYVDYLLGSGPMLLGHAHPEVVQAIRAHLDDGTTFFATHELTIAWAEQIVAAVPCAERVRFTTSGTEATALALRAARAFRGRDRILKFEGGYHGMNDYALMSLAPADPPAFPQASCDSAGIPSCLQDQVLVAPFNDLETTAAIIERYHSELAAVIMEPFQRVICPQPGFLEGVREVTQRHNIPLIFDEIVTGFRFAYGGAQQFYGVTPDLCTLGKAIAGGFPAAAIAGRVDIMECFDPSTRAVGKFTPQIGTFNGFPMAAAAGLATLEILRRSGTYDRLFAIGRQVMEALTGLLDEAKIPAQVVGEPPVFDVLFTDQPIVDYRSMLSGDQQILQRFNELLLAHGVFRGDTKFYISIVHSAEDIEQTKQALARVIGKLSGTT